MKQIKISLAILLTAIWFNACKSNGNKAPESSASSENPLSGASAAFSCAINGKAITGQPKKELMFTKDIKHFMQPPCPALCLIS